MNHQQTSTSSTVQQRDMLLYALQKLNTILDFSQPVPGESEVNEAWQAAFVALQMTEPLHELSTDVEILNSRHLHN